MRSALNDHVALVANPISQILGRFDHVRQVVSTNDGQGRYRDFVEALVDGRLEGLDEFSTFLLCGQWNPIHIDEQVHQ